MLSRTADNLYWLARYVERAEYLARILDTTLRLTALPLAYIGSTNEWESAIATVFDRVQAVMVSTSFAGRDQPLALVTARAGGASPAKFRECPYGGPYRIRPSGA